MILFLQAIVDLSVWKTSSEFVIPVPQSKFYPDKDSLDWDDGHPKSETVL